jgi:hypothetical protein
LNGPFEHVSARHAMRVRIVVFGIWAYCAFRIPLGRLYAFPLSEVEPAGILNLLPTPVLELLFGDAAVLTLLPIATGTLAVLAATGWRFRFTSPFACLAFVVFLSVHRSYGFVRHSEIAVLLAGSVLSAMTWADRIEEARCKRDALPPPQPRHDLALLTMTAALLLAYSFVGLLRATLGGSEIFLSNPIPLWALRNSFFWAVEFEVSKLVVSEISQTGVASLMLAVGFPIITAFEIASPLVLFSRWFRYAWLAVMLGFHVISLFVLNLIFWENLILLGLLVPWIDARGRSRNRLRQA